jgi:hypothetical protein
MHYANRERDRAEDRKRDWDSGSGIGFGSQAGTEARDNINVGWGGEARRGEAMVEGTKTDVSGLRAEAAAAWGSTRASASGRRGAARRGRRGDGRGGDV